MDTYQKNAFTYATIVAIGGFVFGLDAALISGTINFIVQEFSLTDLQLGTVVSAPALGVILALPFAGYASNRYGRKKTLQVIAALYLISAISSALAPSYLILVAARFLGGLAFSSITLGTMYIGEIAAPRWRGKLVAMTQINIVVGLSAAYFINYLILQMNTSEVEWIQALDISQNIWRWMLGAEIIPAFLWLGLLFTIPQSPSWLIYKNRIEDAKKSLQKIYPAQQIQGYIQEKLESLSTSNENRSIGSQLQEIFSKPMRITFIIGISIAIAQQATGINAILFYAPTVFEQLGVGTDAAFIQAIWIGLSSLLFTILSIYLIDRLGRRPLIIWGMIWIILSLGICSYGFHTARYTLNKEAIAQLTEIQSVDKLHSLVDKEFESDKDFKEALKGVLGEEQARTHSGLLLQKAAKINAGLILAGILSFIAAFHFSVGPIMWVLFSEIFPIALRGTAIPLFALITSITSYLIQQFFPWQLTNMGASAIFLSYALMVGVGLIILYRFLPETKNMSIEEIQFTLSAKTEKV